MKKKIDWPFKYDLLLRYRLIEIVALWEGKLNAGHLMDYFGIGRQQASMQIMNIDVNIIAADPRAQQVVIQNMDSAKQRLFR